MYRFDAIFMNVNILQILQIPDQCDRFVYIKWTPDTMVVEGVLKHIPQSAAQHVSALVAMLVHTISACATLQPKV